MVFQVNAISDPTLSGSVFVKKPGKSIKPFVLIGDILPSSFGGGEISGIWLSRPAFNHSNELGFIVDRLGVPGIFIATKKLGGTIKKCIADWTSAPKTRGIFDGLSAPTINKSGIFQFAADVSGDPINDRGIYAFIPGGKIIPVVLRGDPKPGGGSWSFKLREGSISDKHIVFLDADLGSPTGVFRAKIPKFE
jgi:hypothetical protein